MEKSPSNLAVSNKDIAKNVANNIALSFMTMFEAGTGMPDLFKNIQILLKECTRTDMIDFKKQIEKALY